MELKGLLATLIVAPLLGHAAPESKTPGNFEETPANAFGMDIVAPGVVGARFQKMVNKNVISESVISKVNRRLKNRVSTSIDRSKNRAQNLINRIRARDADTDTEAEDVLPDLELSEVTEVDPTPTKFDSSTSSPYYVESMQNRLTYYLLNITLGTPEQQFMVQVDTGSSDLWVPGRIIQFNGFDSKDSSSFKRLGDDFTIKYVKDSAQGFWGVDTFGFGGSSSVQVPNLQFAVATSAPDATMGILGVGPLESEVSQIAYPNLPIMMVRNGLIKRSVYSMYMGGLNDNEGTVLFGGSDKAKYRQLSTLPIVSKSTITVELDIVAMTTSTGPKVKLREPDVIDTNGDKVTPQELEDMKTEFDIYESEYGYFTNETRSDVKVQNHDVIVSQEPINVLLDTGTSLTYLPESLVDTIATQFKASYDNDVGMYIVHQDDVNNSPLQGINFQFQNQIVYMPKSELFWPLSWFSLAPSPYYAMTILASDNSMGYNILGDSFLRNAYVIYDLDEKEVHIGQYFPSPYSHIVSL